MLPVPLAATAVKPTDFGLTPAMVERHKSLFRFSFEYRSPEEIKASLFRSAAVTAAAALVLWYELNRPDTGWLGVAALFVLALGAGSLLGAKQERKSYSPDAARVRDYLRAATLESTGGIPVPGWDLASTRESRALRRTKARKESQGFRRNSFWRQLSDGVGKAYEAARQDSDWRKRQRLAAWFLWLSLEPDGGDEFPPSRLNPSDKQDVRFAKAVLMASHRELTREHPWSELPVWPNEAFTLSKDTMMSVVMMAAADIASIDFEKGDFSDLDKVLTRWQTLGNDLAAPGAFQVLLRHIQRVADLAESEVPTDPDANERFAQRLKHAAA